MRLSVSVRLSSWRSNSECCSPIGNTMSRCPGCCSALMVTSVSSFESRQTISLPLTSSVRRASGRSCPVSPRRFVTARRIVCNGNPACRNSTTARSSRRPEIPTTWPRRPRPYCSADTNPLAIHEATVAGGRPICRASALAVQPAMPSILFIVLTVRHSRQGCIS